MVACSTFLGDAAIVWGMVHAPYTPPLPLPRALGYSLDVLFPLCSSLCVFLYGSFIFREGVYMIYLHLIGFRVKYPPYNTVAELEL